MRQIVLLQSGGKTTCALAQLLKRIFPECEIQVLEKNSKMSPNTWKPHERSEKDPGKIRTKCMQEV